MNKYHLILDKILQTGKIQTNKKGRIRYLLNECLTLTPAVSAAAMALSSVSVVTGSLLLGRKKLGTEA